MFWIIPLLLALRLVSIPSLLVLGSFYGLGLIVLARTIRNVRQETSRNSLLRFLNYVAYDQLLAAAAASGCVAFMVVAGTHLGTEEQANRVVEATILAFFIVMFLFVGVLLLMMSPDLRSGATLPNQLRWNGWTIVLIVIGLLLNLPCLMFFLIIAAPMLWTLTRMDRTGRQSSLIWTLAIAVKRGLPMGAEVEALSHGFWGRHRLRLQLLAENLNAGLTLSAALERQPGLMPASAVMLIRMGEETGCLIPALETFAVEFTRRQDRQSELVSAAQSLLLLLFPLMTILQVVGFVCYYIIPKFKKIFEDFGTELPEVSINFIFVSDMVVKYGYVFIPLCIVGGIALARYLFKNEAEGDWPFLNQFAPRTNAPPVLRALGLLMREQRPLDAGVEAMAWSHPRRFVRRRLEAIHRALLAGKDLADSLVEQQLIYRSDVVLLRTAERVRNLPWMLEQLAERMEQKHWSRVRLLLELAHPIGIVLVGVIVLFVALAFFMPLVHLLQEIELHDRGA